MDEYTCVIEYPRRKELDEQRDRSRNAQRGMSMRVWGRSKLALPKSREST